ncbi:MAG: ribulose phosphate epimerase [Nannocystaceae bacterium]
MILSACSGKDDPEATATNATSASSQSTGSTSDGSDSATSGATDSTTSAGSETGSTTSASSATTDPTGDTGTTGCTFLSCQDGGGSDAECDPWMEDCPEGEKCMPYADDGGSSWNNLKCVPIDESPGQPGDECTTKGTGGVSGTDDCDLHAMCWDVDPDTDKGVCVAFCDGTPDNAMCDPGFGCAQVNDGALNLCLPACDPLSQDCPGDDLCLWLGDGWGCVLDASGEMGAYADPCEYANACDPGLMCIDAGYVPNCQAGGCCTPFCDTVDGPACPGQGQECLPWYEEGMEEPGYETVGVCGIPQ